MGEHYYGVPYNPGPQNLREFIPLLQIWHALATCCLMGERTNTGWRSCPKLCSQGSAILLQISCQFRCPGSRSAVWATSTSSGLDKTRLEKRMQTRPGLASS